MKRGRIRVYLGFFSGPKVFVALILVAVIISIAGQVFGAFFTQGTGRLTLLSSTITEPAKTLQPSSNESHIQAGPTQSQTSSKPMGTSDKTEQKSEQAEKWETVHMRVTAYCPCERCCGEYADGITACGHKIQPGDTFAAADRRYPFGTELVVAGYNNGQPIKVLDRGGAIRGNRLDLFFHTHEAALQWGVKYIDVKVRRSS